MATKSFRRYTTINIILSLSRALPCLAAWNYAVYFDPENEPDRNPFGSGFSPRGPKKWNEVNFYDGFIAFPSVDYGENICSISTQFSLNPPTTDHQQSPIEVEDGPYWACNDRHTTHKYSGASCEYKFRSSPYGLITKFDCGTNPYMDMSRTTTWWNLDYVELKTPGEHVIGTGDMKPGNYTTYDGEFRLVHKGSSNNVTNHTDRIAVISVLLQANTDQSDDIELEKFILGWEAAQKADYEKCSYTYNNNTCSLQASSRRLGEKSSESKSTHSIASHGFVQDLWEDEDFEIFLNELDEEIDQTTIFKHKERLLNSASNNQLWPYRIPKLTGTDHYFGYDGGLTVPPCSEKVWWRIIRQPLLISAKQLRRLNDLISRHLECFDGCDCSLATVGERREGSCHVNVNRPLQYTDIVHHVTDCIEWHSDDGN